MQKRSDLYGVKLSPEAYKHLVDQFLTHYENEMDESMSIFQAERMVDFFIEQLAPQAYNLALDHARAWHKQKLEDMDLEFDLLYRPK